MKSMALSLALALVSGVVCVNVGCFDRNKGLTAVGWVILLVTLATLAAAALP